MRPQSLINELKTSRLSRRLFLYMAVCAIFSSLFITVVHMVINHWKVHEDIETTLSYIDESYLAGMAANVYTLDKEQIHLQMKSILNFPYITFVGIIEKRSDGTNEFFEGEKRENWDLIRTYPLAYKSPSQALFGCGTLKVGLDYKPAHDEILQEGLVVLGVSLTGLAGFCFCLFLIIHFSLTRHLGAISEYMGRLNLNELDFPLQLQRVRRKGGEKDELQELAESLNTMRIRLKEGLAAQGKRATELGEYARSQRLYNHIISSTTDLMSYVDREYRYQAVNNAYLSAHDIKSEEIVGTKVEKFFSPAVFQKMVKVNLDRSFAGELVQYQAWFDYSGVGRRFKDVVYQPHFDEAGEVLGTVVSVRDLTELKNFELESQKLRDRLQQANKMESIGNLAGGIAHDFNNMLSSILGFTQLSLEEVDKGSILEDNLKEVYTASKRAKEVVKQILTFARQSEEKLQPILIKRVVEEVYNLLRSSFPSSIEIKTMLTSKAHVMGNTTQLHQVIMNVCTNAAQAMSEKGGVLEIRLDDYRFGEEKEELELQLSSLEYVLLKISDTGIGIKPEIMENIFEPYFTTKRPGEGTGMGLAVVNGIVESYGGWIKARSTPGVGTVMSIYLPVTESMDEGLGLEKENLPRGKEHILVIDDEKPVVRTLSRLLESLGYHVEATTDCHEALKLFKEKKESFDLIITDFTMPGLTGDKLALEIFKIRPGMPVIICSGYSNRMDSKSAKRLGIASFLNKPILKAELARQVRKAIDAK